MCGGVRSIAARSDGGVSPVRTAAVIRGAVEAELPPPSAPDAAARLREVLVDVGAQRLERRDVDDAHLVGQRRAQPLVHESSSAVRNAASVLPDPVGAAISVWRPSRIAAQPSVCAHVGAPSVSRKHRAVAGWKDRSMGCKNISERTHRRAILTADLGSPRLAFGAYTRCPELHDWAETAH